MPDKIYDFVGDARATSLYTREASLNSFLPVLLQQARVPVICNTFPSEGKAFFCPATYSAPYTYLFPNSSSARIIITTASSRDANPPGRRPSVMPSSLARRRASSA